MASTNKRIYYAIQQVTVGSGDAGQTALHGLQTVGINTSFDLTQVFELGQLAIYQNMEDVPNVEVTLNKVLDGYPLIYTQCTELGASGIVNSAAVGPTLVGRQNARTDLQLAIFPDSGVSASGNSIADSYSVVKCDGMYVSSISYTFPVDGNFTEDVGLVGNSKVWSGQASVGKFTTNKDEPIATSKVNRRQHLNIEACLFPKEIPGVNASGTLDNNEAQGLGYSTHFQNITVSCDLGRESINELGRFAPYHRYASFPVEVTSEFEVLPIAGDGINASEEGFYKGSGVAVDGSETACEYKYNLRDQAIYLETCEGTKISLGDKNKLTSVNYQGGDTGGGNVSITYSYSTFNRFTVAHSGSANHADWYTNFSAYDK